MRDGGTFEDVTWRDITMDLHEIHGEDKSGEPIRMVVERRHGLGKIRNILFDRVRSSSPWYSIIRGDPESNIEDVNLWAVGFEVRPREIKRDRRALIEVKHARDFDFRLMRVEWGIKNRDLWDGFLKIDGLPVDYFRYGDRGHPYRVEQWINGWLVRSVGNIHRGEPEFRVRPDTDNFTPW